MAPHKYGCYLHILTPAGAQGAQPQPWEGITGRVKQLVKQENKQLGDVVMAEMKSSNAAMNLRIDETLKAVGAQQGKLESIEQMLSTLLEQKRV